MRIVVLTTSTNNVRAIYDPLARLGHDLTVLTYDVSPSHDWIPPAIAEADPAWVLLLGAIEGHHANVIPIDVLAEIGKLHLLVHLCCDGAEPAWWPQLQAYYDRGNFALQVNIDGVRVGPIGDRGLTMLCPIDPQAFAGGARFWSQRPIWLGFPGNSHRGARHEMVWDLIRRGCLTYRPRDNDDGSGALYREFLQSCRCVFNHPMTGGTTSAHVKARFVEAALAGCLVFELASSPAEDRFTAGEDYLPYGDADAVVMNLDWSARNIDQAQAMAIRLRDRVANEHSPEVFWSHVHERLGIGNALRPLKQVPFRHWYPSMAPPGRHAMNGSVHVPVLVEVHDSLNFVSYGNVIHVIPQGIGSIDLASIDLASYPTISRFDTIEQARAQAGV